MTAVAVSVDSRDCKTPGCAGESMHARGPYAGLCLACTAVQRKRLSAIQRESSAQVPPETRRENARVGGLASAAVRTPPTRLRGVTKQLEQAAVALEKARAARVGAEERIAELRRDLDVVLGLVQGAPPSTNGAGASS